MRLSERMTARAFERGCGRLGAEGQVPITTCGSGALSIPAKHNRAISIQRDLGARFIFLDPTQEIGKLGKAPPRPRGTAAGKGSPLWSGVWPVTRLCPLFANSGDANALFLPRAIWC